MNHDFEVISEHEVTEYVSKNLGVDTNLNNLIVPSLISSEVQTCFESCSSETSPSHRSVKTLNKLLKSPTKKQKKDSPRTAEPIKDNTNCRTKKRDEQQYRYNCFCFK